MCAVLSFRLALFISSTYVAGRCCCFFFLLYHFSIVSLANVCLFSLKPKNSNALTSSFTLWIHWFFFSAFYVQSIRFVFFFHFPVSDACILKNASKQKKQFIEETAYRYRKVGENAYFLDVLFVYLLPFLFAHACTFTAHTYAVCFWYMREYVWHFTFLWLWIWICIKYINKVAHVVNYGFGFEIVDIGHV